MKKVFLVLVLIFGVLSSSKSESESQVLNGILTGSFVEIIPENNRTELIFSTDSNQL